MLRKILCAALLLIVTACSPSLTPTPLPTAVPNQLSNQGSLAGLQVLLVQSVITVGQNRFAIGLMNNNDFLKNAAITLTFYDLTSKAGQSGQAYGTMPARYLEGPDGLAGIYAADITFPSAGSWGVAVTGKTADGRAIDQKVGFDVVQTSTELAVGQKPASLKTPTAADVNQDLKKLTSARTPEPGFYQLSLDQALTAGKAVVVQVSTPAFCSSRLCGPVYEVLRSVYPIYKDKLNFVQIEVYTDLPNPNLRNPQYAPIMGAWGLRSEPWTYLIDKNGVVYWRAEGLVTVDELKDKIDMLLKS